MLVNCHGKIQLSVCVCGGVRVSERACLWERAHVCGGVRVSVAACVCLWERAPVCGSVRVKNPGLRSF